MAGQFETRVALVTGAASGIGRATALAFAHEGASVVVSDVAREGGLETVRLIESTGSNAIFLPCDVSNAEQVEALISDTITTYGRLDCAVNNAGIEGTQVPTADYPLEVWNKVISINLTGAWLCMKYEIAQMLKQGGGAIVNMASILGLTGFATAGAYVAAKHGLVGATKTAALEYSSKGIRINAVCPGFIETPMLMERSSIGQNPQMHKYISSLHPIGRMGKPEEVAALVLWLCSDAASFLTGAAYPVDGAYTAL